MSAVGLILFQTSVAMQKQNNTHHKSELKSNASVPTQDPYTDLLVGVFFFCVCVFLFFYLVIFIDGQIVYIILLFASKF